MGRSIEDIIAFLRSLIGAVARSLRGNAGLAVLSVVLAGTLWIFVTDTEETRRSGVLPVDIPVEAVNVPSDVVVGGPIPPIKVRIEVAEDEWDSLTLNDFRATVDLLGLQEGTQEVAVMVEALSRRGGLEIIEAIPDKVEVALKPLFSKPVPVVVEIVGDPLDGHELGDPEPESETVIVSGFEELVALVRDARALVPVTGLSEDLEDRFPLEATDSFGRGVEGVVVEPGVIKIRVPIGPSRVLVVNPIVQGSPAEGYNVADVTVEPAAVTLLGSAAELSTLSVVDTRVVSIEGATSDVVRSVSLQVPTGLSVVGSSEVEVRVRIRPALGQATFQVALQVDGLASDLQVSGTLPAVQVTLSGELPTLRTVQPEDIAAVLNLGELGEGTHTVVPEVEAPLGLTVVSVVPAVVAVTLEATP